MATRGVGAGLPTFRRAQYLAPGEAVVINDACVEAGVAAHVHDFYEIALVQAGEGRHLYGTRIEDLRPGDALLVNPSIPHAFAVSGGSPLYVRNVIFTEAALEGFLDVPEVVEMLGLFFTSGSGGAGVPRIRAAGDALALAGLMAVESAARRPGYQTVLRGYLLVLLGALWRRHEGGVGARPASGSWQRLLPVMRRLYETAGAGVSVQEMASVAGWSTDHFSRLFKEALGQTAQTFMRRLRAHRAATLLLTTSDSLDAVAAAAGYADARALRRAFFACFGTTPDGYRRMHWT